MYYINIFGFTTTDIPKWTDKYFSVESIEDKTKVLVGLVELEREVSFSIPYPQLVDISNSLYSVEAKEYYKVLLSQSSESIKNKELIRIKNKEVVNKINKVVTKTKGDPNQLSLFD